MKKRILAIVSEEFKETGLVDQPLQKVTYMTWEELKKKLRWKGNPEATLFLMKQYGFHYEVANMYLNQLVTYPDLTSDFPKVKILNQFKQELLMHHLLEEDSFFRTHLSSLTIQLQIEVPELLEDQALLDWLKEQTTVIEKFSSTPLYKPQVVHFKTMEEEVTYVALQILKQLEQGTDPESILLWNVPVSYHSTIHRIFSWFHLPVSLLSQKTLASTVLGASFLRKLKEGMTKETFEQQVEELFNHDPDTMKVLLTVLNRYPSVEWDSFFIACMEEEFKQTIVPNLKQKGAIQESRVFNQNAKMFVLGFNQSHLPKIWKDEDYFCDAEKEVLHLSTSLLKNQVEQTTLKNLFFSHPNLTITYKDQTPFEQDYPSLLIKKWNLDVLEGPLEGVYGYSDRYNQIQLAKKKEMRKKYNSMEADYALLDHHYPTLPFDTYNNQFTGLSKDLLMPSFSEKLLLSYSHLDHFYRCSFRYYCADLLKIKPYEETFSQFLGNVFHSILSVAFLSDFNFEEVWQEQIAKRECSLKEQFFLEERKKDLKFTISVIQKQDHFTNLKEAFYEKKVYSNWNLEVPVTLMGIFDKVKYKVENDQTLLAIIDYKTGTPELNLNHAIYGIHLQLPIYLYLAHHMKEVSNPKVVGLYLQKILPKDLLYDPKKDYQTRLEEQYRLEGYSTDREELLSQFDATYQNSEVIKSMKMTQNGFSAYAKTLSETKMERLNQLVEEKVKEAAEQILKGQFLINPKRIGEENMGCTFCPFLDLCYRKEHDFVELEEYHHLEFLGGEADAEVDD